VLTRGGIRGTLKGLVFSNDQGKAVVVLSASGGARPSASFALAASVAGGPVTLLVLARPVPPPPPPHPSLILPVLPRVLPVTPSGRLHAPPLSHNNCLCFT